MKNIAKKREEIELLTELLEPRNNGGKAFHGADGRYYYEDEFGRCTYFREAQYEEVEEKEWVPKYKNNSTLL